MLSCGRATPHSGPEAPPTFSRPDGPVGGRHLRCRTGSLSPYFSLSLDTSGAPTGRQEISRGASPWIGFSNRPEPCKGGTERKDFGVSPLQGSSQKLLNYQGLTPLAIFWRPFGAPEVSSGNHIPQQAVTWSCLRIRHLRCRSHILQRVGGTCAKAPQVPNPTFSQPQEILLSLVWAFIIILAAAVALQLLASLGKDEGW